MLNVFNGGTDSPSHTLKMRRRKGVEQLAAALEQSRGMAAAEHVQLATPTNAELRRQLQGTLQTMAAAPLEIRQRQRSANEIAASCGESSTMWVAFCSVCGQARLAKLTVPRTVQ